MEVTAEEMGLTLFVHSQPELSPLPSLGILSDLIVGISGWPECCSKDVDMTYDISCVFKELPKDTIFELFHSWFNVMTSQNMDQAPCAENISTYTCSIYRIILDPSLRTISRWAKATGCFPVSVPIEDAFNFEHDKNLTHELRQITVPFKTNAIKYMDPSDLVYLNGILSPSSIGKTLN